MKFYSRMLRGLRWADAHWEGMLRRTLVVAVMAAAVIGCGKRQSEVALNHVEGQVFWKGQPLAGAQIALHPQGKQDEKLLPARARTDAEGRFRLGTFDAADGAVEGEYLVTITHRPIQKMADGGWAPGGNILPPKYATPKTTDLRVHVASGANQLPAFDLK